MAKDNQDVLTRAPGAASLKAHPPASQTVGYKGFEPCPQKSHSTQQSMIPERLRDRTFVTTSSMTPAGWVTVTDTTGTGPLFVQPRNPTDVTQEKVEPWEHPLGTLSEVEFNVMITC